MTKLVYQIIEEYMKIKKMDDDMASLVGSGRTEFRHIKGLLFSLRNKIYEEILDIYPDMKW